MPRKIRKHISEGIYHVTLRGNNRQKIFFDSDDREKFFQLLASTTKKYGCTIHMFCLMTNHAHILMEVNDIPLSKIMLSISPTFARYVNKKQDKTGHLFQGRYHASFVDNENYLCELCHYIHNNPVAAGMVDDIGQYPWSSHSCYTGKTHRYWLTTEFVHDILKKNFPNKTSPYEALINKYNEEGCKYKHIIIDPRDNLVLKDRLIESKNNQQFLDLSILSIKEIIIAICAELDIQPEELDSSSRVREICLTRSLVAYFSHYHASHKLINIARYFSQRPDSVAKRMHEHIDYKKFATHKKRLLCVLDTVRLEKLHAINLLKST